MCISVKKTFLRVDYIIVGRKIECDVANMAETEATQVCEGADAIVIELQALALETEIGLEPEEPSRHERESPVFQCGECSVTYDTLAGLQTHVEQYHSPYQCG